ncbi:non-ribosomal peptide synthetase [Streptomyces jumonjinensis]|uniref:Amino acid adenylation domain-containing protein n=1 Tax=Streptomyces jumonjinensis TaxID=1945 RepID=A0A646KX99_STRJU|nr:non-ribosomal peptide synthetase [Streptomyces jumonjinensis]MQT05636.1 amino acid adenylation domain-containing protein [Streptomyces jumonjinensis]
MALGQAGNPNLPPVTHPMSYEQEAIWLNDELGEGVSRYVESWAHRLRGPLDVPAVEAALSGVVQRHESLRTRLRLKDGQPCQEVLPALPVPLIRRRVTAGELHTAVREAVSGPLPLDRPPLLRATLLEVGEIGEAGEAGEIGEGDAVLAVAVHHAAVDGWSLHLLDEEFSAGYRAAIGESVPAPPPIPLQPGPYARAQRAGRTPRPETAAYWRRALAEPPLESTFPLDRPRPYTLGPRGGIADFTVDRELTDRLYLLCRELRTTPFAVLAAAVTALIARHGEGNDVVLGTPVSRRDGIDTEPLIACLAEVLPLRLRLEPGQSFRELVAEVRQTVRSVKTHRDMPYTRLVAEAGVRPTRARTPLFQVVLTVDDGQAPGLSLPGVRAERLHPHDGTAKFDVLLHLRPENGMFRGRLEYAADLFDPATARLLAERFRTLLDSAVTRPDAAVADLAVLTRDDRERVTGVWAHGPAPTPGAPLAHEAFVRAARRTPDATAVEYGDERLTFAALDAASDAVAARLTAGGHGRGRVAVLLERSLRLPVAVLGVLKAGGCCVPLDPGYPADRIAFMLRDSGAGAVLTDRRTLAGGSVDTAEAAVLLMADPSDTPSAGPPAGPPAAAVPVGREDPAYMVYTSGSTGRPKGVPMPHRALAVLTDWQVRRSALLGHGTHRTAQFAPLSFDVAFQELFTTWACGGTLVLVPEPVRRDPARLLALIADRRIERLFLPYVALQQIAEYAAVDGARRRLPALREVVSAGEQLYITPAIRRFFTEHSTAVLDNQYGPSETHVVTAGRLTGPPVRWPDRAPVGRPVPGASIHILDDRLTPVPPGAVGEICIGGESVAPGYHGRPDLTRRKFVPDPFVPGPFVPGPFAPGPARLYRSGDMGRFLPDGTIEFHGRRDEQVKIRGYRVELGEIESAVKAVPGVADAVVTADAPQPHRSRLLAHYIPAGPAAPDAGQLRRALRELLPGPLIPALITAVPGFPLTPSGKVDRAALSAPDAPDAPEEGPAHARTASEHRMAELWREVLGVRRVGVDDDFFSLGGDSLLVVRLLLRVYEEWGVRLSLGCFFAAPTVSRMAALAEDAGHRPAAPDLLGDTEPHPSIVAAPFAGRSAGLSSSLSSDRSSGRGEQLLLTGATGFLGVFLLHELLRTTDATVHCLVRACDTATGTKRLRAALDAYGLNDESFPERIRAVPGDLAQEGLGLPAPVFDGLARRVDAVYHSGAAVHLAYSYEQLRMSNVRGTAEVLRLAALHRTVPLHHISTVGVHSCGTAPAGPIRPEDPLPPADRLRNGYAQSKWAAEVLLERARERGLPVSVYRPSRICGASDSGLCQTSDYFWLLLRGCVEAGLAPVDLAESFDLVPVDYVSRAVVALSRTPGTASRTFHLSADRRIPLARAVDWLRALGYGIDDVPLADWRRAVEGDPANTAFPLLSLLPSGAAGDTTARSGGGTAFDATSTREALRGSGIDCPEVDGRLFALYVESYVRTGFLPPPPR